MKMPGKSSIQSLMFPKVAWTPEGAKAWLKKNSYKYGSMDSHGTYYKFRQRPPKAFRRIRTIYFGHDIVARVGYK